MFESLQTGLRSALKTLSGKAKLSEANMREGLSLVQQSLLEADVSYEVAKDFVDRIAEQAMGEKVLLALNPTQQLVGIITDGDLRRKMQPDLLDMQVETVMTKRPKTIRPDQLASEALEILNSSKITALFVVEAGVPIGVVHMHDLLRAGVA